MSHIWLDFEKGFFTQVVIQFCTNWANGNNANEDDNENGVDDGDSKRVEGQRKGTHFPGLRPCQNPFRLHHRPARASV